ncbi:MAG: tetratricopeptide repeat protein [Nitrospirae bacterium]|nr:tetratricopeptide repeat protein [Nitrospirota bacterium]
MAYRKRVIEKTLKKPDEFISTIEKMTLFVEENIRVVIIALASAAVIGGTILGVYFYKDYINKKAAGLEYQAMRYYDGHEDTAGSEGYKKSIELFEDLIKKYPNSRSAAIAQYNIGNAYFRMNDISKAEEAYKRFIDKYSGNNILLGLVMQKLAYVYIAKKDYDKAIEMLNKIISDSSIEGKDQAYFELAKVYDVLQKKDDAVSKYEALVKNYSSSPWAAEGAARLKTLKGEEKK